MATATRDTTYGSSSATGTSVSGTGVTGSGLTGSGPTSDTRTTTGPRGETYVTTTVTEAVAVCIRLADLYSTDRVSSDDQH